MEMGIIRGGIIVVERHAPLGDPMEIVVKNYHLLLRLSEADLVEVEKCR